MEYTKGSNANSIKQSNRAAILKIIKQREGISRSELSRITHLSKGGITPIIGGLLDLRLIKESGNFDTSSGRKPTLLTIEPSGCCAIAVDFTRENYVCALVDFGGNIISLTEYSFTLSDTLQTVLEKIESSIAQLISAHEGKRIIGIGVVAPGPLDHQRGVILTPPNFRGWENIPIVSWLGERFSLPVLLDNDANAYCLAEKNYGVGRTYRDFIHVTVGQGIGAGIILGDAIYRGAGGFGSEIGHTTINMDGPQCQCGNRGCLELYATIPHLVENVNKALEIGASSSFLDGIRASGKIKWNDIVAGLAAQDSLCINIMQQEAAYLANTLISLINVLEPRAIILGGKLAEAGSYILGPLKQIVLERTITRKTQQPELFVSRLPRASLIGGATMVIDRFIEGSLGAYETLL